MELHIFLHGTRLARMQLPSGGQQVGSFQQAVYRGRKRSIIPGGEPVIPCNLCLSRSPVTCCCCNVPLYQASWPPVAWQNSTGKFLLACQGTPRDHAPSRLRTGTPSNSCRRPTAAATSPRAVSRSRNASLVLISLDSILMHH